MPTHDMARYVYPIIEVTESPSGPSQLKKNRSSTLKLAVCPPEAKTSQITRWRRPSTVVETAELRDGLDDNLVLLKAPNSSAAKSYRLLRHRLLSKGDPRIIAVSSASAAEGKTCCAINLALALAESVGSRVLLLESNLGNPSLAKAFGFTPTRCFAEQMADFEGVVKPWIVTKLDGTRVELAAIDPAALEHPKLDRVLFASALRDLKSEYDYIVVDTPPVLESADVNVVVESVDGVVLVALAGKTRKSSLRSAIEQLAPARVLGITLLDSIRVEAVCR